MHYTQDNLFALDAYSRKSFCLTLKYFLFFMQVILRDKLQNTYWL